ncbi:hypothetical protein OPV22_034128 [Ensete ventricosum]|uniref:Uncharacterized protein n=1 Tax=Ensete ventricosum TaxID=4639 RepID=A0AAV8Q1G3_ENSVE|nr:hypothetical protein OPV22_034128 [Ensete ventricosum]
MHLGAAADVPLAPAEETGGPSPPRGPWRSCRLMLIALAGVVLVLLFLACFPSGDEGGRNATGETCLVVQYRDLEPKTDRSCAEHLKTKTKKDHSKEDSWR